MYKQVSELLKPLVKIFELSYSTRESPFTTPVKIQIARAFFYMSFCDKFVKDHKLITHTIKAVRFEIETLKNGTVAKELVDGEFVEISKADSLKVAQEWAKTLFQYPKYKKIKKLIFEELAVEKFYQHFDDLKDLGMLEPEVMQKLCLDLM